jgi:glycosyltransferase involved in cell wall biosynthesis
MISVAHVIAYFAPAFAYGGPARSVLAMCQAQIAAGVNVEVFTTTANIGRELPPCPAGTEFDGVRVRYFQRGSARRLFHASGLRGSLQHHAARVDVIHVHGLFNATSWSGARIAQESGRPYVLSTQGMLSAAALRHHGWRKRLAWQLFDRAAINRAAVVHAATSGEEKHLEHIAAGKRIAVVPHIVAHRPATSVARAAVRQRLGFSEAPFVLFLGRIHPIKRLDLLATAFRQTAARTPDLRLVLAGSDGDSHRRQIEPLFASVADRITWLPEVDGDERAALLAEATALVQCSDSESFGMAIAEALAAGVPVVATTTCPWPEIASERCGAWVEHRADAIADALNTLVRDRASAKEAGSRGAQLISSRYSAQAVGSQWRSVYERMLG